MEQQKTRHDLLQDLVDSGTISSTKADEIEHAPVWSFSMRELVSYLASVIIAVGVLRIVVLAFEDASEMVISASLYVVSIGTGFGAWKTQSGSVAKRRFSEVLELGSLGAFVGASALALSQTSIADGWIGVCCASMAVLWGGYRCRWTTFAGTLALVVGIPSLGGSFGELTDSDSPWVMAFFTLIPGIILLLIGTRRIGVPRLARAAGSLFYIIGTMPLGADLSYGKLIPVALGAILFAAGSWMLAPEMLIAGAFLIVAGVVMSVVRWVSNDLAQGLVIIATGLAMLAVLSLQMKRTLSQSKTETQVA